MSLVGFGGDLAMRLVHAGEGGRGARGEGSLVAMRPVHAGKGEGGERGW